jgi:hypothetical protein
MASQKGSITRVFPKSKRIIFIIFAATYPILLLSLLMLMTDK